MPAKNATEVIKIIAARLQLDPSNFNENTTMADAINMGADSLDLIEVQMDLEEAYRVRLPDESDPQNYIHLRSVSQVVDYLKTN